MNAVVKICKTQILGLWVLLLSSASYGQDSVLYMWDDLILSPDLDREDIISIAQVSQVELKVMRLYLNVCQKQQPENKNQSLSDIAHLEKIGKEVKLFINSLSEDELSKSPAVRYQDNYESQKKEMPIHFPKMEKEQQIQFCKEVRDAIRTMSPKGPVPKKFLSN